MWYYFKNLYHSLKARVFPLCWNNSLLIPLHKYGNRHLVEKNGGIVKLNISRKLLERVATQPLSLSIHSYIFPRFSTEIALARKPYTMVLEKREILDLQTLQTLRLLEWISSYLHNRSVRFLSNSVTSDDFKVMSCVRQGGQLERFLFIVYNSDLPSVITSSRILKYANDAKMFSSFSSKSYSHHLQTDFTRFR